MVCNFKIKVKFKRHSSIFLVMLACGSSNSAIHSFMDCLDAFKPYLLDGCISSFDFDAIRYRYLVICDVKELVHDA